MTRRHGGQAIPPVHTRVCPCTRPSLRASWAAPPCPIRGRAWQHSARIVVYSERAPPRGVGSCFNSDFRKIDVAAAVSRRAPGVGLERALRARLAGRAGAAIQAAGSGGRQSCFGPGAAAATRLTAQGAAPPAIAKAPAAAPAPAKTAAKTVAQAQPVIAPPPDAKV